MKSNLRKIGNSRGVLIPAPFLAACGIEDEIVLRLDGKRIIIEPVHAPRAGWFDDYREDDDENVWLDLVEDESDQKEWQW
ncbi:MAG TPA: AbrB/MazE/SpoVT family DNA-binding domain-containing protein [Sedimenticola thiotaurini]|uniref:AbrB/MazE/SpoVT family DNA-binding domain-containing protein n=1 Tax=Sedimenticola thiotaurini TaxID=1543721 RepID=A0A831RQQ9_9GAMM|nr:AbrB/MazE/SpoVT family DNA-binding domain-containing protein [Sedimenticola thiotaurini]